MHAIRTPLRRRFLGAILATLVVVTGGLMLASSASAHGQDVCPGTNFNPVSGGWIKYEPIGTTSYTYPQLPGFTVSDVCYKASTHLEWPAETGSVTSTVTNWKGEVQAISHVSVQYTPRPIPPRPPADVDVQTFTGVPTCEEPSVTVGTITTTTPYVWNAQSWSWVAGTPVVDDQTHQVSLTEEDWMLCQAGPKPDPVRDVQAYTGEPSCETPTVLVGEVITTTDYFLNYETGDWEPMEPVIDDQRTELSLTEAEILACQIPEKPEPVVEHMAHTGQPTCAAPTVLVGEVTTTTGWVLDGESNTWVPGDPVVTDERTQVSLTAAQLAACVPTQPTQPTQPTLPTLPTAPTAPLALASTGSPALLPVLTALGLVLMGATALVARRRLHA